MLRTMKLSLALLFLLGCAGSPISEEQIAQAAASVDYGDFRSVTLASKGWAALDADDHPAVLAYTRKCIELYGERAQRMNDELTLFPPVEKVNDYWALNDAGTCMFIMASSFENRRMYGQAADAFRKVAEDYSFAQCWDPKGWYWQPGSVAAAKAKKYAGK